MKVLVDTNLVLDVLLGREPFVVEALELFEWIESGQIEATIAATTITNIFYILRKAENRDVALNAITRVLQGFALTPVTRQTIELALQQPTQDFEDGVQIACAEQAQVNAIITRNPRDFAHIQIPVWSVAELRSHLPS
jgi:predicted nucleic acid-binding protein